ncbi:steroidogenic acute regulatory protein, mitochondrial-like isoform X1 [Oxyura jamaicensis]|uniref:steroidogenic acute regulatory protein, mitochondrial-like isoform X1 n=2 Tax=Oxyura jamaicensis TaxID=8884 RepID=UPI0015A5F019|nr:steroidogenic acute regulatory protein, mitochondrial-like isoform X1 [Oxyura jamaicensis]
MLQATVKLCCGIAHDHLRRLPGLKLTAVAAIQRDVRGLVLSGSHQLPSEIPCYIQRLMGKDAARCTEPGGDVSTHRFSSTDLSYIHQGERALQRALSILQHPPSWQAEAVLVKAPEPISFTCHKSSGAFGGAGLTWCCAPQDAGAAVSSAVLPGLGRVFRVEAVLAAPVGRLHRELFEELEQMPRWNPSLSRVEVLQRLGEDTLVTHEVTATSPVGRRDFVSVRHRRRAQAAVYLVGTAARLERLPAQEDCVRAETRLSCIALQPLAGDPGCTRVTWLLSVDLKGWIPAAVTDRVLPRCQADFIGHLRRHLSATARP